METFEGKLVAQALPRTSFYARYFSNSQNVGHVISNLSCLLTPGKERKSPLRQGI
jgi:hypothetical protein